MDTGSYPLHGTASMSLESCRASGTTYSLTLEAIRGARVHSFVKQSVQQCVLIFCGYPVLSPRWCRLIVTKAMSPREGRSNYFFWCRPPRVSIRQTSLLGKCLILCFRRVVTSILYFTLPGNALSVFVSYILSPPPHLHPSAGLLAHFRVPGRWVRRN